MKPRIFISSTCYDLKFVREDLAEFVREYGYEPILSENGDIGYTPGQNLDKSCYAAMQTADMVILIIGSEYGSAASGETKNEFEEYISITRNEFRTAIEAGIPVFSMIDKKVIAEYGIYEENIDDIEKKSLKIKFKITKDLNVFRFIKEIKTVAIPIQEFEHASDIKGFISKQWADMFKNYLVSLKEEKENKKIESSVNEMKALIQKMDIMLDSVGKSVLLKESPEEYEDVIYKQDVLGFCDELVKNFGWRKLDINNSFDKRREYITKFLNCLLELNEKELMKDRFPSKEEVDKATDVFRKHKIAIPDKFRVANFNEKIELIYDSQKKNSIIDTMVKNEYFYKLIVR